MKEMKNDNYKTMAALAAQVKGFLAEDEGEALYNLALEAASQGPCLEIGSFCGKSAVYLGTACKIKGVTLFTIDHHLGSEEQQPGQLYFDPEIYDERKGEIDSFPLLRETLRKAELENTVVPMVTWSKVAARNWTTPLGLVFIDGGHSYEAALTDYLCWNEHLVPGGYLIFHDIYLDPAKGGQAPYEVYKKAVASSQFDELPMVNSLGILKKRHAVMF
ncbi:MAG: class I SAM-dependent methyltransferase [Chloroflexi bacterium]|nr:class I SAM-dependent methyltransferase [Chloroflexota bacterium]